MANVNLQYITPHYDECTGKQSHLKSNCTVGAEGEMFSREARPIPNINYSDCQYMKIIHVNCG